MILKKLELSNFQTIENYTGEFIGNVYLVTGENEVGKSTLLKAIAILLTGKRDEVLKLGTDKGFAKAIIGENGKEYDVELNFTTANPRGTLTITDKESGLSSSKVSTIQDVFGYNDFDANEFTLWSKTADGRRKQVEIIKSLLPENVQAEIAKKDVEIAKFFDRRTLINSEVSVYKNLLKSKSTIDEKTIKDFEKPVDSSELVKKVAEISTHIEQYKGVEQRYEDRKNRIISIPDEIKANDLSLALKVEDTTQALLRAKEIYDREVKRLNELSAQNEEKHNEQKLILETELVQLNEKQKTAKEWLEQNKPEDIESVKKQIENADLHNSKHNSVKEYLAAKEQLVKAEKEQKKADDYLLKLRNEREKLITESQLPVEGLTFTDDGLFLNGIPFETGKIATSEEMEVAAKLIIAKNPKTKVFRIARGESLGSIKLKAIIEFAKKHGYQGFIEEVVRGQNELVVSEYTEK